MEKKTKTKTDTIKNKKKPITIRQTLTSIYRIAKTNPIMVSDNAIKLNDNKQVILPDAVTRFEPRETLDFRDSLPVGHKISRTSMSLNFIQRNRESIKNYSRNTISLNGDSKPPSTNRTNFPIRSKTISGDVKTQNARIPGKPKTTVPKIESRNNPKKPNENDTVKRLQDKVTQSETIKAGKNEKTKMSYSSTKSSSSTVPFDGKKAPNSRKVISRVANNKTSITATAKLSNNSQSANKPVHFQFMNKSAMVGKNRPITTHKVEPINKVDNTKVNNVNKSNNKLVCAIDKAVNHLTSTSRKLVPVRRSLSAQFYDRNVKRQSALTKPEQQVLLKTETQSLNNLSTVEESPIRTITFKSPSAYQRRSISLNNTPLHKPKIEKQLTPHPKQIYELQKPLNEWLKGKDFSMSSYHHLKCFGLKNIIDDEEFEEDKENIEFNLERSQSYEDLHITCMEKEDFDTNTLVKDALEDLHKLIIEGYPLPQCEMWLGFIRQKCNLLEEEPHYWECRAAIEQARGNITSAVEYYKTSIIKGAEVEHIDESLNNLLEKFSLLNIEPTSLNLVDQRRRDKQIEEVRNIFKSSIIQFAVQERAIQKSASKFSSKSEEKKFLATPVRRSTRKSRTCYTSTPGITTYDSWSEVDKFIQHNKLNFKGNNYIK